MKKKKGKAILDTRSLKIISVKKVDLVDSLVFIILDESKFGRMDKSSLRALAEQIENIEPTGIYFPMTKDMNVQIYDMSDLKGKELVITVNRSHDVPQEQVEEQVRAALPKAKSITFIHHSVEIEF